MQEKVREQCFLRSFEICACTKYRQNDRIEIEGPLAETAKVKGTFQSDSEEKRPPEKPWSRWKDNIKQNLKKNSKTK